MTRILLVEDYEGTAEEILLELARRRHEVRHATSLASASLMIATGWEARRSIC